MWWSKTILLGLGIFFVMWLRFRAALTELWLDELWSLELAGQIDRLVDLFTHGTDNNHLLNTWMLWLLGQSRPAWLYRLPSVLLSIATVGVAYAVGVSQAHLWKAPVAEQRVAGLIAAFLVGLCYPVILTGTEARGYGALLFFCLLTWWTVLQHAHSPRPRWALWFGAFGALALLSHATALFLLVSIGLYQFSCLTDERRPLHVIVVKLWRWHKWPFLTAVLLFLLFFSHMSIAGGNPWTYLGVVSETFGLMLGLSPTLGLRVGLPLFAVGFGIGLYVIWQRHPRLTWLYITSIVLLPGLIVTLQRPIYLSYRYFLVSVVLLLCLCSIPLTRGLMRGSWTRVLVLVLLFAYAAGNLHDTYRLHTHGRGACLPLLQTILTQTEHRAIVAYDHQTRTKKVLRFFVRRYDEKSLIELQYVYPARKHPPDWLILHDTEISAIKPPVFHLHKHTYHRVQITRSARGHGMQWFLYKRQVSSESRVPSSK